MRRLEKKGQLKISFGVIVSIILIVIFIMFSFFVIQKFLGVKNSIQLGQIKDDLQKDVDRVWKSSQGSEKKSYFVPNQIRLICFADFLSGERGEYLEIYDDLKFNFFNKENLFFYPSESAEGFGGVAIENLNIEKITEEKNPSCLKNNNGIVEMTIKKDFNENLVTVTE